jgi:hypothetical protein
MLGVSIFLSAWFFLSGNSCRVLKTLQPNACNFFLTTPILIQVGGSERNHLEKEIK